MFYANEDPAFKLGLINNALETVVITVKDIFTNALLFVAGEGAGEGISVGVEPYGQHALRGPYRRGVWSTKPR